MITKDEKYQYQYGGSLPQDACSYVTREADETFYQALKAGQFCYVLNTRQMGKSSLRVRAMEKLKRDGIICICIDLLGIGKVDNPEQWYAGLVNTLVSDCSFLDNFDFPSWWEKERVRLSPLQLFRKFIETILLEQIQQKIIIFIDEIDRIISLNFSSDDFFSMIRFFSEQRNNNPKYKKITFALLGVATPSDLIRGMSSSRFNIGTPIPLEGFQDHEVEPLIQGLRGKVHNPERVMKEILTWTGGQPFLTQKLCKLIIQASASDKDISVEEVVKNKIINNWESQDEPEHLKTIRDRILNNEKKSCRLLGLYKEILKQSGIEKKDIPEEDEMNLRLSGLVFYKDDKLKVANPIYKNIFNIEWIDKQLKRIRPYGDNFDSWVKSNFQNYSYLLKDHELKAAQEWAKDKNITYLDRQFLEASSEKEKLKMKIKLDAQTKANEILKKRIIKTGRIISIVSAIIFFGVFGIASLGIREAKKELKEAKEELKEAKEKRKRILNFTDTIIKIPQAQEWSPNFEVISMNDLEMNNGEEDFTENFAEFIHLISSQKASSLAKEGKINDAIKFFKLAKKYKGDYKNNKLKKVSSFFNDICWYGSLKGSADNILDICNEAVKFNKDNGFIKDSRGLARAMKGDYSGAIDDFKSFIDWYDNLEVKQQRKWINVKEEREAWIKALNAGQNPFTQDVLQKLLDESI